MLLSDALNIPCLLEFWSNDVFTEMLSTVVHFLNRDCGSLILFISMFTFKFEFIPKNIQSSWKTQTQCFYSANYHYCPNKHLRAYYYGYFMLPSLFLRNILPLNTVSLLQTAAKLSDAKRSKFSADSSCRNVSGRSHWRSQRNEHVSIYKMWRFWRQSSPSTASARVCPQQKRCPPKSYAGCTSHSAQQDGVSAAPCSAEVLQWCLHLPPHSHLGFWTSNTAPLLHLNCSHWISKPR